MERLASKEGDTTPRVRTLYLRDPSKSAISKNSSPDIGFNASLNPYRGCTHGCAYCYARPTHEYLGFSAGLDFETRVLVKPEMPKLLRKELGRKSWEPQVIAMSGVTDAYQPVERTLEITRGCLRVLPHLLVQFEQSRRRTSSCCVRHRVLLERAQALHYAGMFTKRRLPYLAEGEIL